MLEKSALESLNFSELVVRRFYRLELGRSFGGRRTKTADGAI
jgi:hypothetical protein